MRHFSECVACFRCGDVDMGCLEFLGMSASACCSSVHWNRSIEGYRLSTCLCVTFYFRWPWWIAEEVLRDVLFGRWNEEKLEREREVGVKIVYKIVILIIHILLIFMKLHIFINIVSNSFIKQWNLDWDLSYSWNIITHALFWIFLAILHIMRILYFFTCLNFL